MQTRITPTRLLLTCFGLLLSIAAFVYALHACGRQHVRVEASQTVLPADGREHLVFRVVSDGRVAAEDVSASGARIRLVQNGNAVDAILLAPVMPGEVKLRTVWRRQALTVVPIRFVADTSDSFGDGTPDFLRLHRAEDRIAFRRWFTLLAERQADLPEAERASEINDCAALLRYAYRETLRIHDEQWAVATHLDELPFASVQQYRYPDTPLGTGLFRIKPGPYAVSDATDGSFAQFADAHTLMAQNTYAVGRDLRAAKMGDLIFYRQLEQNSPYHSMIVVGDDANEVVYHTGPIGKGKGEMRHVALADLMHHPDARWHPVAENSNFLGVFRWNVLREGE